MREKAITISKLSVLGGAVALVLILFIFAPIPLSVSTFIAVAVLGAGFFTIRFFEHDYTVYFWAIQVLIVTMIAFLCLGTFTSSLALSLIAVAGIMASGITLFCVKRNGEDLSDEERAKKLWAKLRSNLSELTVEQKRSVLENSLRYKLTDDKLDGDLDFSKPLFVEDGRARCYSDSSDKGKAEIGAYIDRIISTVGADKGVEV